MPLEVQVVLLRVLQTQEVVRVGGKYPIPIDVRVIAATHRDLAVAVQERTFRNDLYYRLNVLTITLPLLKDRNGDILRLTEFFLDKFRVQFNKPNLLIDDAVIRRFECYHWPGNIRELENVLQRACVICEHDLITLDDLPITMFEDSDHSMPDAQQESTTLSIEEEKRNKLIETLLQTQGNIREVSTLLKISRGTVYNMLSRYNLDPNTYRATTEADNNRTKLN